MSSIAVLNEVGNHSNALRISVEAVDGFCGNHRIDSVDFIKIDVEGAELQVLQGATHTIERSKPHILIELHETLAPEHEDGVRDSVDFLQALGYRFQSIFPGLRTPRIAEFAYQPDSKRARHIVFADPL